MVFFPSLAFGGVFSLVLLVFLGMASWEDLRQMAVPKWVTLTTLALGLLANLVRGALLGSAGQQVWVLSSPGPVAGAADGLLFALAGFALAFVVFFVLWVLGVAGGGDVKLYAAIGSWVGPGGALFLLPVAAVFVLVMAVLQLAVRLARRGLRAVPPPGAGSKSRLAAFSLPLTLATALLLLGVLGHDRLVRTGQWPPVTEVPHDAR
jgi:prepilin peptidase CpaA